MKLIGSLTSPYVRKIRVMLLEKNLPFDLVIDSPWEPSTHVSDFNPLGKVPALVTDEGETLFDSNILAEYIELLDVAPPHAPKFLPADRAAALRIRQLVMLADGIADAGVAVFLEIKRPVDHQDANWLARQHGKILRGLAALESRASASTWLAGEEMSLADIALGCVLLWLDIRVSTLKWRDDHPALSRLVATLSARPSFQNTIPPA
ncbi:glutathione S-transferase [Uliginosibacterium sp. H3]|uniref:Glutathione S-transferase n=1 Tax=Uliginosibacterium silvisoli TaxID=3114758 RepID=A0ABU6JZG1_9RHOO|nr:glutathione S-transferase [Uliginosibacterium sp. H3]